ncbi:MAG: FMN-binding protein [Clostridiales bacterium]|nr:FMN-binding protein [Clostridiales bacterium]
MQVTIKDGKITAIQVLSHSGETASYFSKAKTIISRILKAQSPNVDTVSGATYSSTGIREAVKAALKKAAGQAVSALTEDDEDDETEDNTSQEVTLPEGAPADGSYTGTGECTKFGYSVTLTAVFQNGVLTALEDFTLVDNDDEDNEPFAASAWAGMKTNLLSGSTDVVSGATYSSNAILAAYQDAYAQAVAAGGGTVDTTEESDESDDTEDGDEDNDTDETEDSSDTQDEEQDETVLPADGTYTASALCEPDEYEDFEAYTLTADVTFEDGKLVSIDNLTSTDESNVKYYTRAAEGTSKYTGVVAQLIEKQSSEDIDVVTNATCSSKTLVAIYEDAYAQAVAANSQTTAAEADTAEDAEAEESDAEETPEEEAAEEVSAEETESEVEKAEDTEGAETADESTEAQEAEESAPAEQETEDSAAEEKQEKQTSAEESAAEESPQQSEEDATE